MKGSYVHLRYGLLLAKDEQASLLSKYLGENNQIRFECLEHAHDATEFVRSKHVQLLLVDFERFGASGVYGLADLMAETRAPVILIVRDISDWEREQLARFGVFHIFERSVKLHELGGVVSRALRRQHRVGSSGQIAALGGSQH